MVEKKSIERKRRGARSFLVVAFSSVFFRGREGGWGGIEERKEFVLLGFVFVFVFFSSLLMPASILLFN